MKRRIALGFTFVAAIGIALTQFGTAIQDDPSKATIAEKQFEQMKKLVGNWEGSGMLNEEGSPAIISYKLTAADSVIMETLFGGTPGEMITMYHLDGEDLMLTHYCSVRNQPRMKAKHSANTNIIDFAFIDGTNMNSKVDPHMHNVKFNFLEDNRVETTWTMYSEGSEQNQMKFHMHRVKK